jgi:hypothetical protein
MNFLKINPPLGLFDAGQEAKVRDKGPQEDTQPFLQ